MVLTAHPDSCLLLYPRVAWEPIGAKVQALSSFNEQARWWQRLLDGQGRILISPALRKFAGLKKDVMLVGQGSHFEIWDIAAWDERLARGLTQVGANPPPGTENFSL